MLAYLDFPREHGSCVFVNVVIAGREGRVDWTTIDGPEGGCTPLFAARLWNRIYRTKDVI